MARDPDDGLTVAAIGVAAATIAAVAHETLGHGGACLATGGQVTLLTSIYFHCAPGRDLVDAAGPVLGLACGAAALALRPRLRAATARLFLLVLGAFALFWFFGQLARDGLMRRDDWAFAVTGTAASLAFGAVGIAGYIGTMRLVRRLAAAEGVSFRALLTPYLAGAISAAVAGAAWRGGGLAGAREGLLTLGLAPLGYVWAVWRGSAATGGPAPAISRSWLWVVAATVVFVLFVVLQGRGLGRLA